MNDAKEFELFRLQGKLEYSGGELFCRVLQELLRIIISRKTRNKAGVFLPIQLDQNLILEAFEDAKTINLWGIDGQKIQEILITAILKFYLKERHKIKTYLAASPHVADDIVLLFPKANSNIRLQDGKLLATGDYLALPIQVKEMRPKQNMVALLKDPAIFSRLEQDLFDTDIYADFENYFKTKFLVQKQNQGSVLLIFSRPLPNTKFNSLQLIKKIRELNNGHFKEIWYISPVAQLKQGPLVVPSKKKNGHNFEFYIKELINSKDDTEFATANLSCTFDLNYLGLKTLNF